MTDLKSAHSAIDRLSLKLDEEYYWSQKMEFQSDRYTYRITWSEENKEYVGLCVEFPSLSWLAGSQENALKGIRRETQPLIINISLPV